MQTPTPKFGTIDTWMTMSGLSRRTTYERIARGDLKAKKVGDRTMIDIEAGLAWIESCPDAVIRSSKSRKAAA